MIVIVLSDEEAEFLDNALEFMLTKVRSGTYTETPAIPKKPKAETAEAVQQPTETNEEPPAEPKPKPKSQAPREYVNPYRSGGVMQARPRTGQSVINIPGMNND